MEMPLGEQTHVDRRIVRLASARGRRVHLPPRTLTVRAVW